MELIDKTTLLEKSYYIGRPATVDHPWSDGAEVVDVEDIEAMPTIDAVPVVHSRWKFNADGSGTCENCHFTQHSVWDYDNHQRYCGVCGARMDLEEVK